ACWRHDDRRLSPSPLWGGWRQPGGGGRRHSARYSPTRPLRGHPPHKGRENSGHTPAKELIPSPPPRRILFPIRSRGRFAQRTWGDRTAGGGRYRHPWGWGFPDLANGQAARPGPESPASRDAAGVPFYYWASPASRARPNIRACTIRVATESFGCVSSGKPASAALRPAHAAPILPQSFPMSPGRNRGGLVAGEAR